MAKPQAVGIDIDEVLRIQAEAGEWRPFIRLQLVSEMTHEAVEAGELSPIEGILLVMDRYLFALEQGEITVDQYNSICANQKNYVPVYVPLPYIAELMGHFRKYAQSDASVTLGEAFGLEGGGQGKRRRMNAVKRFNLDHTLCDSTLGIRAVHETVGTPISLEKAYSLAAEKVGQMLNRKITADRAEKAWRHTGNRYVEAAKAHYPRRKS